MALLDVERVDRRGQIELGWERGAHRRVQLLVLGRCDLTEPGRSAATVTAGEESIEQMMGRRVDDDLISHRGALPRGHPSRL